MFSYDEIKKELIWLKVSFLKKDNGYNSENPDIILSHLLLNNGINLLCKCYYEDFKENDELDLYHALVQGTYPKNDVLNEMLPIYLAKTTYKEDCVDKSMSDVFELVNVNIELTYSEFKSFIKDNYPEYLYIKDTKLKASDFFDNVPRVNTLFRIRSNNLSDSFLTLNDLHTARQKATLKELNDRKEAIEWETLNQKWESMKWEQEHKDIDETSNFKGEEI